MASALSGDLANIKLINVLKLLVSSDSSGKLLLQKDGGLKEGELYLDSGNVVHAVCDMYLGEPAVYELLLWNSGKFEFDPDEKSPQKTIEKATGQILSEGTNRTDDWEKIRDVIPSVRTRFIQTEKEPKDVRLKAKDWDILNAIGEGKSISEVSAITGIEEMEVANIFYRLAQAEILKQTESEPVVETETVGDKFFKVMDTELVQLIGPVASIIIDDVIQEYGTTRATLPKNKVAGLVEMVSKEISDQDKRIAFQQKMLKEIRNL